MTEDVYQRVSVQVPKGDYDSFASHVPHGQRAEAIRRVMRMIDDAIIEHGPVMLGALMLGDIKITLTEHPSVGENFTGNSDGK